VGSPAPLWRASTGIPTWPSRRPATPWRDPNSVDAVVLLAHAYYFRKLIPGVLL
jgi:hypothetical protein